MTDFKIELSETIRARESIGLTHKRVGFKRFLSKIFNRWKPSGDPKLSEGVHEEMVIDRVKGEYHQRVTDAKTGKILHEEHEPLSEHRPNK